MSQSDSVIALYCGAGGLSLGFSLAGARPSIAADIDKDACATYRSNIGGDVFNVDLSETDPTFSKELSNHTHAFALIGGPPCQGFSSAGLKNGNDKRNKLIFNYFATVEKLKPRWFLFENVEGLLTANKGKSVADLVAEFIRIGYRIRLEKVSFAAYGLPQARKRVLIVGNRLGLDFDLPAATHSFNAGKHKCQSALPFAPSLNEAVSGLGGPCAMPDGMTQYLTTKPANHYDALMRDGKHGSITLHFSNVQPNVTELLSKLQPGETMRHLPEEYWHESFKRRAFRRVMDGIPTEHRGGAPSGVKRLIGHLNSLTITSAASREFIHPSEDRPLTLRECARLQSFADTYQFAGSIMSISRQIGNAFPPLAATVFAKHLTNLDGSFGGGSATDASRSGALIGYRLTDASGKSPALANTELLLESLQGSQGVLPFELCQREIA